MRTNRSTLGFAIGAALLLSAISQDANAKSLQFNPPDQTLLPGIASIDPTPGVMTITASSNPYEGDITALGLTLNAPTGLAFEISTPPDGMTVLRLVASDLGYDIIENTGTITASWVKDTPAPAVTSTFLDIDVPWPVPYDAVRLTDDNGLLNISTSTPAGDSRASPVGLEEDLSAREAITPTVGARSSPKNFKDSLKASTAMYLAINMNGHATKTKTDGGAHHTLT